MREVDDATMKIVVCVKQVPDSWAEKSLSPADNTLDRGSVDAVMNEIDEYAIEEALRLIEAHGGEVVVLSMGPAQATDTIRKALSMGADSGVHIVDDGLHGSDAVATSLALAKASRGSRTPIWSSSGASRPTRGCPWCRRWSPSVSACRS